MSRLQALNSEFLRRANRSARYQGGSHLLPQIFLLLLLLYLFCI